MTRIRAFGALAVIGLCAGVASAQNTATPAATAPAATAPAATAPAAASTSRWVRFKGDLLRTSVSRARVTLPLNLNWRYSSDEEPRGNTSTPLVTGPANLRRIYFSTGNAIHCLEGNTGTALWKTELTGFARAPIFLLEGGEGGDLVIATTSSGTLNAMRASDGTVVWTAETRTPVGGIEPVPVQTPNGVRLIQATQTGRLMAFGTDGARDPDFDIKLGRNGASPTATPTLSRDGRMLFVPAQDRNLYAISLDDNSVAWTARLGAAAYVSPVPAGDALVAQVNNELIAVFEADGQAKWRTDLKSPLLSPIAVREENGKATIFAGTFRGEFFAIDGEDGATIWQSNVESPLTGTPLVLPNMILTGTRNGMLVALSPEDGKILWRFRLHTERTTTKVVEINNNNDNNNNGNNNNNNGNNNGNNENRRNTETVTETRTYAVASAPAAVDGQVYVVADNAALYALSSTPLDTEAPIALKPSIAVRSSDGRSRPQEITARRPVLVPGKAPVVFSVEIDDPGSGIDPAGFRVTLDGTEVPKDKLVFQPTTGLLSAILADVDPTKTVILPDAVHTIGVLARDTRGNVLTFNTSFTVDKSVPPPDPPQEFNDNGNERRN